MKDYIKKYLPEDKKHYCSRYIKIIEFYENIEVIEGENHHILPRKLFPELKDDFNNVVRLSYKAHYLVHWLLAKIFGGCMWFALLCRHEPHGLWSGNGHRFPDRPRFHIGNVVR